MPFNNHSFCLIFLVFFLSFTSVICMPGTPSTSAPSTGGFWLTVELIAVEFQKSCISTALCHQPAFKLTQTMTLNGQKAMMSWPLEGGAQTLVQKESPHQQFVSHWVLGDPEDVSMDCQIAGTDPSFGFARICDETPARRLFQEQLVRHSVLRGGTNRKEHNSNHGILSKNDEEEEDEGLRVQMKGRCFNATLLVKKHTARCPWCPDPNVDIQVVGGTAGPGGQQGEQPQQQQRNDALELQNALILALTGAVVFSLSGFCCAIFVHLRYRKRRRHSAGGGSRGWPSKMTTMTTAQFEGGQKRGKKPRILKLVSPPRAQKSLPVSLMGGGGGDGWTEGGHGERATILYGQQNGTMGGAEEQRYDIPWDICENKFCLVPRQWVMGGGNGCHAQQQQQPCAILDSSTTQSLAFSGGIEPLHSSTEPYATCADICQISAPQQQHHQALSMNSGRPPLPPPLLTNSGRHSQQTMMAQMNRQNQLHLQQQQQQTFSPNTSGGGSSSAGGRHDDSGLDSV